MYQKQINSLKLVILYLLIFSTHSILAQVVPASISSALSVQTDAVYGPTLIICSNKSGTYEKSVSQYFGIKWNVN